MLTVRDEIRLEDFNAWSGAYSTLELLIEHDLCEDFEDVLNDCYPEGIDTTKLNDLLWFEKDWIWDVLDIDTDEDGEPVFED